MSADGMVWWLGVAGRAALILGVAGLGALALRGRAAAARHQLWALGVLGALALPALGLALSGLRLGWASGPAYPALVLPAIGVSGVGKAAASTAWLGWLGGVWAVGAVLVWIRALRGHLAARRLWQTAEPVASGACRTALAEAAAALGVTQAIDLRRSAAVGSPMTIGLWPAHVLLPADAVGWSPERLRAVLLHELGHVARRDTLLQGLAQVLCALYWPNPLAWVAAARLRVEREHACDDLVLAAGVRPSSYAADLLEVARRLSTDGAVRAGAVCMAGGVEARLRRVLSAATPRQPLGPRTRRAAWILGLAGVGALAATAAPLARPAGPVISAGALSAVILGEPDGLLPPPALALDAPYDLSGITAEVQRHLPELQACYQRRLQEQPDLAGEVVIHWVLQPDGQITEQCIRTDTVADDPLRECVNALVAASDFPAPSAEPLDVTLPLVFRAGP